MRQGAWSGAPVVLRTWGLSICTSLNVCCDKQRNDHISTRPLTVPLVPAFIPCMRTGSGQHGRGMCAQQKGGERLHNVKTKASVCASRRSRPARLWFCPRVHWRPQPPYVPPMLDGAGAAGAGLVSQSVTAGPPASVGRSPSSSDARALWAAPAVSVAQDMSGGISWSDKNKNNQGRGL